MDYPEYDFVAEKIECYLKKQLKTLNEKKDCIECHLLKLGWNLDDLSMYLELSCISMSCITNTYIKAKIKSSGIDTNDCCSLISFLKDLFIILTTKLKKLTRLQTYLDKKPRSKQDGENKNQDRIEKLVIHGPKGILTIFHQLLTQKNIIEKMIFQEFCRHVRRPEDRARYCTTKKKIRCLGKEERIPVLIGLLADEGFIQGRNIFEQAVPHLVNEQGKSIRNMSQKKSKAKTSETTYEDLNEIIKELIKVRDKASKN